MYILNAERLLGCSAPWHLAILHIWKLFCLFVSTKGKISETEM